MSTRRSTRERPGGDLVDRAVQVVDPALQRDGEVDEVLLAAAEQHAAARRGPRAASTTRARRRSARRGCDGAGRRSRSTPRSRGTLATAEREDDLVLGRVVRRRRLARHRLDVDLDRRRQAEQAVDVDVRERHRLRLARVDDVDLLLLDDRLRRLLDRQRDADVELLEVARVLDGDLEREVGRRGDLVVARARRPARAASRRAAP